jgi:hypothetical protein
MDKFDNAFVFGRENHLGLFMVGTIFFFWLKNNQNVTSQMIVQHVHLEVRA